MSTTEKILQTMNSWQSGEVIAVRQKKCSGASSRPTPDTPPPELTYIHYDLLGCFRSQKWRLNDWKTKAKVLIKMNMYINVNVYNI